MPTKIYDQKSYDLAEHFLLADPTLHTIDKIHHLALHIQQSIEDWIDAEHQNEAKR